MVGATDWQKWRKYFYGNLAVPQNPFDAEGARFMSGFFFLFCLPFTHTLSHTIDTCVYMCVCICIGFFVFFLSYSRVCEPNDGLTWPEFLNPSSCKTEKSIQSNLAPFLLAHTHTSNTVTRTPTALLLCLYYMFTGYDKT